MHLRLKEGGENTNNHKHLTAHDAQVGSASQLPAVPAATLKYQIQKIRARISRCGSIQAPLSKSTAASSLEPDLIVPSQMATLQSRRAED